MFFLSKENELNSNINFVLLYFYYSEMVLHQKIIEILKCLQDKHNKNISFFAIDVVYFASLRRKFEIESVPTVILMNSGIEIKRINGLMFDELKNIFTDI